MQLADMPNLLMLDPRVALMLIDQPSLDTRRTCALDVDRIDVAGKFNFVGPDSKALKRHPKDPWIGLRDTDDVRVDYHVEELRQPESLRVRFDLSLRIGHDRELVPGRLERLQRLERARPYDAPQCRFAMDRAKLRRALDKLLVRNSCRRHPSAKKMLVRRIVGLSVPAAHQMSIDCRAPRIFGVLECKRIEPAPVARELPRQQFEIQERERAAKVEEQRLEFFFFLRSHSAPA